MLKNGISGKIKYWNETSYLSCEIPLVIFQAEFWKQKIEK